MNDSFNAAFPSAKRHGQLAALLARTPAMRQQLIDTTGQDVPACVRNYPYRVSAWPFIVSRAEVAAFEHLVQAYAPLCFKAMRLAFGHDAQAFADYLLVTPMVQRLVMETEPEFRQMLNRHDVVFSGGQLRIVEVNAGSSIGGWQLSWLEAQYKTVLKAHPETARWALQMRNVMDGMFSAVLRAVQALAGERTAVAVLCYVSDAQRRALLSPEPNYRQSFERARDKLGLRGDIYFFSDFDHIVYHPDRTVWYEGRRMHTVLLGMPDGDAAPAGAVLQLTAANLAGNIVMPDNPLHTVVGNKALLALLHEAHVLAALAPHERDFVLRHVPYTLRLCASGARWRGYSGTVRELLLEHQRDLVIKKAHSRQGRDVYIGRYCSAARWRELVEAQLDVPDWLAQEYCAPDQAMAIGTDGELSEHALVWGIFDSGQRYGGAFVRAMPQRDGDGVINSAKGAIEFPVFEEAVKINKLEL